MNYEGVLAQIINSPQPVRVSRELIYKCFLIRRDGITIALSNESEEELSEPTRQELEESLTKWGKQNGVKWREEPFDFYIFLRTNL